MLDSWSNFWGSAHYLSPMAFRTGGRYTDDSCSWFYRTGTSVSVKLCSRSDAVCGRRRADPRNVRRQPFQYRNDFICCWLFGDDGSRCCTRIKTKEAIGIRILFSFLRGRYTVLLLIQLRKIGKIRIPNL